MTLTIATWVVSTAAVFGLMVLRRSSRLHRRARFADLDWKALLLLAAIAGAIPAFVYDQVNHRPIDVPQEIRTDPIPR